MEIEIFNEFRKVRMLQNTDHDIMLSAEQSAHLSGRVIMVNRKSAFVWGKSTNGAAVALSGKSFGVPFGSDAVATFEFFTPLNSSAAVRFLVALNSLAAVFRLTVSALVLRIFGADRSLLLNRSHNVLLANGLPLSSYHSVRN